LDEHLGYDGRTESQLPNRLAEGVGVWIDPLGADGRDARATLFARIWLKSSLGPPDKSQLSGASYSAYQKQPTGGCEEEEVARYEAHTYGVGGSRADGGDGS
jgi:hypothetical protein